MTKYDKQFKLPAVQDYARGEAGFGVLAQKYGVASTHDQRRH